MNQSPYVMSNNQINGLPSDYLTQVPGPFLNQTTEIVDTDLADQSIQITATPEQQLSLLNPMYDQCLKAADDQHTSSLVLDYLTEFDEERDHDVIRSNPEAEKIFTRIELVKRIIEKQLIQAYKELHPNNLLRKAGNKYGVVDKTLIALLKNVLEQGVGPLEKYDCEHNKIVVQAFNEILGQCDPRDLHSFFNYPNDLFAVKSSGGTQLFIIFAELMNQVVERIYQLTQEQAFKYQQKKRSDRSRYQQKMATKCVDEILTKHSRILVIRVDFRYGKLQDPSLAQVKEDLRTCLRHIKRTQSLNVLGYIWKLEFAEKTGYHYHCFFFLDGREHSQDIKLAQQIGEIWEKVVGSGGAYHNCNLDAHNGKYAEVGIGTLQRNDKDKYRILIEVIRYITKRDQFIVHKRVLEDEDKERQLGNKKGYFVRVFGTSLKIKPTVNAKQEGA
ncbi:inovirus Gp2 family protein [Acinetobacter radioresistens]|uniref:YagK/YfjJ domain-containing protein n=1 Tax=Acinetobacter radioresistens TaxID=40216 RepID=UPI002006190D|nr:inovirus-type Gp2 protein [Acinetobacter radioresistens]MCK4088608.1 inovirus Gp2 family protein [Acinetobacter radioresistens]